MSVRLTLAPLKQEKVLDLIKNVISKQTVSVRDIAKLIGTLEACLHGVQFGRLYLWHLQHVKNEALKSAHSDYDVPCKLSGNAYSELKWWSENITDFFRPISRQLPEIEVYSDACLNGWGGGGGGGIL